VELLRRVGWNMLFGPRVVHEVELGVVREGHGDNRVAVWRVYFWKLQRGTCEQACCRRVLRRGCSWSAARRQPEQSGKREHSRKRVARCIRPGFLRMRSSAMRAKRRRQRRGWRS